MRVRLLPETHKAWSKYAPPVRSQLAAAILAAALDQIDLDRLLEGLPEIRMLRKDLRIFIKLALIDKVPIPSAQANRLLRRLDHLLGTKV